VENPAAPQHPAFPSPAANNLSLPSGINGNNSLAAQALVKVPMAMMPSLSISK
jgi:hypothetical protein